MTSFRQILLGSLVASSALSLATRRAQAAVPQDIPSNTPSNTSPLPGPNVQPIQQLAPGVDQVAPHTGDTSSGITESAGSTSSSLSSLSSGSSATSSSSDDAGSSRARLRDVIGDKKYAPDREITDPRLRLQAGSLSRYSLQANVNYQGSTVNDFSNPNQPNPDHRVGPSKTSIGGGFGARYRFDSDRAIGFGTGFTALTPFNGIQREDVKTPYLRYDVTKKMGVFQVRISPGVNLTTIPERRDVGEVADATFEMGAVYDIGMSRFAASLDGRANYNVYSRGYIRADSKKEANPSQADLGVMPGIKYMITDHLNVASSIGIGFMNPRRFEDRTHFTQNTVTGNLGVGWAIRRDVYIYPYLSMYPGALALDTTSLNFQTIFNIL